MRFYLKQCFSAGALFSQCESSINSIQVSVPGSFYSYKAYLEALLEYNKGAKESWMEEAMWTVDDAGNFDSVPGQAPLNEGFALRKEIISESKIFDILFTPKIEMFNQNRLLLPCDLSLKFFRQPSSFFLLSHANKQYRCRILNGFLNLHTYKMSQRYQNQVADSLKNGRLAKYPLLVSSVNQFLIPKGTTTVSQPMVKLGKQGIRIYVMFVENSVVNGDLKKNPFKFIPYDLSDAYLIINGKQFPRTPLKLEFEYKDGKIAGGAYMRAYHELARTTGVEGLNDGWGVGRMAYPKGFFILGTKTTDAFSDDCFAPSMQGGLSFNFTFKKPVPEALSCLYKIEYQNSVNIDANGLVQMDYTT